MASTSKMFKFASNEVERELSPLIDWSKCILCQQIIDDEMVYPVLNKRTAFRNSGYESLAENILKLHELYALPMPIDLYKLKDDGITLSETFEKRNAIWHKKCGLKFNKTEVKRVEQRKAKQIASENEDKFDIAKLDNTTVRRKRSNPEPFPNICFFCDEPPKEGEILRKVSTKSVEEKIRKCVAQLGKSELSAKLSEGDMIARERKYHLKCLAALYNSCRIPALNPDETLTSVIEGIAFSDLLSYIEEVRRNSVDIYPVFKMPALVTRYSNRMKELISLHYSTKQVPEVHRTRLREKILVHFGDMRAEKSGREYLLFCEGCVGDSLRLSCDSYDEEAVSAAKVAKLFRRSLLSSCKIFNGEFKKNCQVDAVDPLLLSFINALLYGPNIRNGLPPSQQALTICQLIAFNIQSEGTKHTIRHRRDREPPLPVFLAMDVHAKTRKRELVDMLHDVGLSVSYDRLLRISSALCGVTVQRFHEEQVMCPPNLRIGLFTTAAFDNLDYNPSSTTSEDSFHGTSISLFQHPTPDKSGYERKNVTFNNSSSSKSVPAIPEEYENVPPAYLIIKEPPVPADVVTLQSMTAVSENATEELQDVKWLENSINQGGKHPISWSAFHAQKDETNIWKCIVALLPLFHEDSKSVAMLKHGMDIIKKSVNFLNPGQVPVITLDQPLYALAKTIQWNFPETYGESKFMFVFGSLHIEQDIDRALGKYLDKSGWTDILVKANVATSGVAESYITVSNIAKTRLVHQITALALYQLMRDAYNEGVDTAADGAVDFDDWRASKSVKVPMFKYWSTCLDLELLMLLFVRSHRTANYELYVQSLKLLIPWFFALDLHNYARWLPVYLRDLIQLSQIHPDIHEAFKQGMFVVNKTKRPFSSIGIDQAHEQNNAVVKGEGGAIGLLLNPPALRRWMLAGPEISRLLSDFENSSKEDIVQVSPLHHEQGEAFQTKFATKVIALKEAFLEVGNPFCNSGKEIFSLDNSNAMDEDSVKNVMTIEKTGKEMFQSYVDQRIIKKNISIYSPIPKNKLRMFVGPKKTQKSNLKLKSLKNDVDLFSKLFIISMNRDLDLDQFFSYENQPSPPSISLHGKMRTGDKAALIPCLTKLITKQHVEVGISEQDKDDLEDLDMPELTQELDEFVDHEASQAVSSEYNNDKTYTAIIYDGPALVHILDPKSKNTFSEYSNSIWQDHIVKNATKHGAQRIDIVWDTYSTLSTKSHTRETRGLGSRKQVRPNGQLPKNWKNFLRNHLNKMELFTLLAQDIVSSSRFQGIEVISTIGSDVVANTGNDYSTLQPCNHEEADSRIFLHVNHAVLNGLTDICIRTVDTDVLVLAISFYHDLQKKGLKTLWMHFGSGTHFKVLPIHEIATILGEEKSVALRGFHAFTGCDTTSFFVGRGKRTMWNRWNVFPAVTEAFRHLSFPHVTIPDSIFKLLQRFIVMCYSANSELYSLNQARKELFTSFNRTMINIPPTSAVLMEHSLRSGFQSGHVWGQALVCHVNLPSLQEYGWLVIGDCCVPRWSSLPEVSKALQDFMTCKCKRGCKKLCKCQKNKLNCSLMCSCKGECQK